MNRPIALGASFVSLALFAPGARAEVVVADTRDDTNLFDRRLLNRELGEQLAEPDQGFRVGKRWGIFSYAVDAEVASVQRLWSADLSRFHGYFIFDNFAQLRAAPFLDLNLNLLLFNPSASDGVRVSSYAVPGGGIHFHHDFEWAGHEGRIDLLGTDIDVTTLGSGLLLEQWPLEGAFGNLRYGDLYYRQYYAGRVFWPEDDVVTWQLGAFDGRLEAMLLQWKFLDGPPSAWYADVSGHVPLFGDRVRLAGELATNLRERPRFGALGRADYGDRYLTFAWHLGYQFRWYQQGFGPRRELVAPTTTFNLPFRAEGYATNPFAYFGISEWFEQWSHTVMAETELPLGCYFRTFFETEAWLRFVADREGPVRSLGTPEGDLVPGTVFDLYYRLGLRLYPLPELPYRLSLVVTNKQVRTPFYVTDPIDELFERNGHWVAFMMEGAL